MKISPRSLALHFLLSSMILSISAQAQYHVVGYYPMWERAILPASSVKYNSLTHLIHAFAWPNADGSIASDDVVVDTALINTTHRAGRKILLSYGGAGTTQTNNFATVTADSALRKTFINNIVSQLSASHYDGADLDWEGPSTLAQKANEVAFVRELRSAFLAVDTTWLITMAIGASDWSGQWRDFTALAPSVDWFNAMEYDFHGSWSSISGHNAPLMLGTDPLADPDAYSIVQSIQYLAGTRAIPKDKLVLGLPFYGKSFGTSTLYTRYSGEADLAYSAIIDTLKSGSWTYMWDSASNAPYYTSLSPPELITLDDSASIALKCQYARTEGLAGVMIWEISQDLVGQEQPLMDAIGAQMITTGVAVEARPKTIPAGFVLYDNYPNPFNPSTTIKFSVPFASNVTIKVFDVLGREVATLLNERRAAGAGSVRFDVSQHGIASGVYFYRIQAGAFDQTKKMILLQ